MRHLLLFFFFSFISFSCKDEVNPIPSNRVYLKLDLTFEDKELKAIPSYKEFTIKDINIVQGESIGFGGVLVVHNMLGEYKAFDRACTYEVNSNTTVVVDEEVLYAECPVCGTKYEIGIGNGAPNGKSRYNLKQYNTTLNGSTLIVHN
jgi:hypothetical protein